jgi:hypothetical protein
MGPQLLLVLLRMQLALVLLLVLLQAHCRLHGDPSWSQLHGGLVHCQYPGQHLQPHKQQNRR